jgi:uncharacterized protein (DUF849 family)
MKKILDALDAGASGMQAAAGPAAMVRAGVRRPVLLHGFDATVWELVALGAKERLSTRVGLEDGYLLPDGTAAASNAALVTTAAAWRMARAV